VVITTIKDYQLEQASPAPPESTVFSNNSSGIVLITNQQIRTKYNFFGVLFPGERFSSTIPFESKRQQGIDKLTQVI